MKQDFEEIMNRKMEEGDVLDVHSGFDKNLAWQEIESRLPQKKRKLLVLGWSHAAALLVGVIISAVVGMLMTNKHDDINTVVVNHTDTVYNTIVERDATIVPHPQQVIVKAPMQKDNPPVDRKHVPAVATVTLPVEELPVVNEEEAKPETLETTVVATKKKVTVIHLLDIENEDRRTALYHNDPSAAQRSGFAIQISAKRLPDNRNSEQSSVLVNLLKR